MKKNIIFIFEFISGGGFRQINIPSSLFCEGFGMLRSIIADFKVLGFEIHTMLDNRIFYLSEILNADNVRKVERNDNYLKIFKNLVKICNYVFIIAPESSKILYNLTKIVRNHKKMVLSTNLNGIKLGSSKIKAYNFFRKRKISTPTTYKIPYKQKVLDLEFILKKFREIKNPIVIKPEDGVGAELIKYFEDESQILSFFKNIEYEFDKNRNYILQEFVEGKDMSISLIGGYYSKLDPLILSINVQDVNIKNRKSEYFGGNTPSENYYEIINNLSLIIEQIKLHKIEGYFGIDFILKNDNSVSFLEINPRLTTSYMGLRNVINYNCAELIFNSKTIISNKPEIRFLNYSHFTRLDFLYKDFEKMDISYEDFIPKLIKLIPEFVTPPISLDNSQYFSCFIATKSKDYLSSKIRVNEIINQMKDLNFNISMSRKAKLS
ncbi:MAG: ATP-grasp domain-containing protein [Promethearchaeota archaeon]